MDFAWNIHTSIFALLSLILQSLTSIQMFLLFFAAVILRFVCNISVLFSYLIFTLFVQVLPTNHSFKRRWQNCGRGICQNTSSKKEYRIPLPLPLLYQSSPSSMSNNASVCMFMVLYLFEWRSVCSCAHCANVCVALILVFPLLFPTSSLLFSLHFWWLHAHPTLTSKPSFFFNHYFELLTFSCTPPVLLLANF